jgi:uncharacterized protein YkwD
MSRPRIIPLLVVWLAAVALLLPPGASATRVLQMNTTLEKAIVKRVNAVRAGRGLPRLRIVSPVRLGATRHATSMGVHGYFSHSWCDGTPFGRWIRRFYSPSGYRYWTAGENLYWTTRTVRARNVVRAWMRSPSHRAIILTRTWRHIGVAAVRSRNPSGTFRRYGAVSIIAAEFGRRY